MTTRQEILATTTLLLGTALLCGTANAGRPLAVDDANVDAAGTGHVEAWLAQAPGARVYSLAPAYAPVEGLELGALLARDQRASVTLSALQAKWRITPSRETGCNLGAVAGLGHATDSPNNAYLNGLLTCNHPDLGSTHLNLGVSRPRHAASRVGWGMAYEKPVGNMTPHVEWFGSERAKPTIQVGLRGDIAKGVQLDGSVGRSAGAMLYTLGTKLLF
jgi:hypothetical protein